MGKLWKFMRENLIGKTKIQLQIFVKDNFLSYFCSQNFFYSGGRCFPVLDGHYGLYRVDFEWQLIFLILFLFDVKIVCGDNIEYFRVYFQAQSIFILDDYNLATWFLWKVFPFSDFFLNEIASIVLLQY